MRSLAWRAGLATLLGTFAIGCGGGGGSPTAPSQQIVAQGTFNLADPLTAVDICTTVSYVPFTTPQSGDLSIAVNWTAAGNDIDIALTRGNCTCQDDRAGRCDTDITEATSAFFKPERIFLIDQPAATYTLSIGPFKCLAILAGGGICLDTPESGTYSVTLTSN